MVSSYSGIREGKWKIPSLFAEFRFDIDGADLQSAAWPWDLLPRFQWTQSSLNKKAALCRLPQISQTTALFPFYYSETASYQPTHKNRSGQVFYLKTVSSNGSFL